MNLGEMKDEMALIIQDQSLQSYFQGFINNAILELAADFDLPTLKLLSPQPFSVITDSWVFPLPENFHKKLFRCANSNWGNVKVTEQGKLLDFSYLDRLDIDHDETADHVRVAAVATTGTGNYLGVYPKAEETLQLWYYRKPLYLEKPDQACDCIPPEYHGRVIIPRAIIKSYQLLMDQVVNFDPKPLQYWEGKLKEGLYGSPYGPIGLINYLIKIQGGPRRHGGRDPLP